MKKFNCLILICIGSLLTACGSSGTGSSPASSSPAAQGSSGQVGSGGLGNGSVNQPAIDYSTVSCSTVTGCVQACAATAPALSQNAIEQTICNSTFPAGGSACNAVVNINANTFLPANIQCLAKRVTQVLGSVDPLSSSCGSSSFCAQACSILYPYISTQSILNTAAASGTLSSGGTLKLIYENALAIQQYQGCVAAPAAFSSSL